MEHCAFCRIASGKVKPEILAEGSDWICFADIKPVSAGHCLVIPKKHFSDIFDIPEKELQAMIVGAKKAALRAKEKYGATGVNILHASGKDAQQSVFHFHIHIVPRYPNDKLDAWVKNQA